MFQGHKVKGGNREITAGEGHIFQGHIIISPQSTDAKPNEPRVMHTEVGPDFSCLS